jgi:hypothetical protein
MSDRRHKTIAAPGDRGNVSVTALAIRKRAAERPNMNLEIALSDETMGPDFCDQLALADQLTGTFGKSDQEIESTIADTDGLVAFEQQSSCWEQPEVTKGDTEPSWLICAINHLDLPCGLCAPLQECSGLQYSQIDSSPVRPNR